MDIQVIYLEEDDDIASIRDRLDWARQRRVLLVLPARGDVLTEFLDLIILQRHAQGLYIEIGLVTADHRVIGQAKGLGIPTFSSVRAGARSKRGWWRGRRKRIIVGQPTRLDEGDLQEVTQRKKSRPAWQRWLFRYIAIVLGLMVFAILLITAAYTIPGATITLRPEVFPLEISRPIVADPFLETVDFDGDSVPGRILVSVQEWQAEVNTTGNIEVDDAPSAGSVVFVNQLDQPVTIPAGTRVSTSAGDRIVFQTMSDAELLGFVGGTVEVDVVAIEPGAEGNVAANRINRIEGPLAIQLEVRNLQETQGGGGRLEKAVTEADVERLRSHVMQQLQIRALADLQSKLNNNEFLATESLRVLRIIQETYSDFPGERSDILVLDIRAELQATAVDESQAVGLTYEMLAAEVPEGFELVPASLFFESGEVESVDDAGRITFSMNGSGIIAAEINEENVLEEIAGQPVGVAAAYLFETLPLRDYPAIYLWPDWFDRLPFLPIRMRSEIDMGI